MSVASRTGFPGGNSDLEPPDPIPNSEVKRISADGSVGPPHVRVGHCQDLKSKIPSSVSWVFFCLGKGGWDRVLSDESLRDACKACSCTRKHLPGCFVHWLGADWSC